MDSFAGLILTAFALVFVIEGLAYAVFPESIKRLMKTAMEMPVEQLRSFGMFMALLGSIFIWLLRYL